VALASSSHAPLSKTALCDDEVNGDFANSALLGFAARYAIFL
jgi:hypothetical protein